MSKRLRLSGPVVIALVVGMWMHSPMTARAATTAQVEEMITKAKAFLYSQQKDGHWEVVPARDPKITRGPELEGHQWGGQTALCVYALLAAGEDPQNPKLAPAIEFMKKSESIGTYATALRCQVWLLLPQTPDVKALMKKDSDRLLEIVHTTGPAAGFYNYAGEMGMKLGGYSLSRSQYGVLGVWAAAQSGCEISTKYWTLIEASWRKAQDKGGGWQYNPVGFSKVPVTPGISAAGLATMYIAQEYTSQPGPCKGNLPNESIERGLKYMEENLNDKVSPGTWPLMSLYAFERIGVASGRKYFGPTDWFDFGAEWLLKNQQADGRWTGLERYGVSKDTCFGLLFLARGRAPILMNKLEFTSTGSPPEWNQRPRDVANLARWLGRTLERDINWQVTNLKAPVGDLFDAPILFMSGTKEIKLEEADTAKLKEFIEGGGMILGHADCSGKNFSTSFKALGAKLFPTEYKFRELPDNHPIHLAADHACAQVVLAIDNG